MNERICNILKEDNLIRQNLTLLINKTIQENREYGINICIDDKVSTTEVCKGTECSMRLSSKCPEGTNEVVSFHGHPGTSGYENLASGRDYITAARHKEKNFCIGYKILGHDYVDCYKVPEDIRKAQEDFSSSYNEYFNTKEKEPKNMEKLSISGNKLRYAYVKILDIDNMTGNRAIRYAVENKICSIPVSFRPKVHKSQKG